MTSQHRARWASTRHLPDLMNDVRAKFSKIEKEEEPTCKVTSRDEFMFIQRNDLLTSLSSELWALAVKESCFLTLLYA